MQLLNHILTREHGKKIAVIENEFGEVRSPVQSSVLPVVFLFAFCGENEDDSYANQETRCDRTRCNDAFRKTGRQLGSRKTGRQLGRQSGRWVDRLADERWSPSYAHAAEKQNFIVQQVGVDDALIKQKFDSEEEVRPATHRHWPPAAGIGILHMLLQQQPTDGI